MSEIDQLLAQLKEEYSQVSQTQQPEGKSLPPQVSSLDNLLSEIQEELDNPVSSIQSLHSSVDAARNKHISASTQKDNLLKEIQLEYQEREKREQQQEEQRKRKKQELLKQQAKEWLKQLNPKSEEGRWFAEFSCSYDSPLEAAMDYLEALRESGSG